jgi:dihydrofolate reductase
MRKLTYGGATSLDGYLARADHSTDWLLWSDEVAAVTAEYWQSIDTVLMGRKTYEVARKNGQGGGYPGVVNHVFSRTLAQVPAGVTLVREDAVEYVRRLKEAEGRGICLMGGGELARSLFEADLIDEVGFNVQPVILGAGIPALHPLSRSLDLELMECRRFANGCVYVLYCVRR